MAFTESNWVCESSSIIGLHPNYADCPCISHDDRPCVLGGQSIDVQSGSASCVEKFHKTARLHGRSWQDSFDFQEFGFSYNVVEPADVAPADELFYKGRILPLQTDTRLHVVQALSSCCMRKEVVEAAQHAGRPSSVNKDDEVRFNSCRIEGAMYDKAIDSNALGGAMRSLSFRSHHSGYWESGAEKDTTDTSSSSRDSNGSSQDSYFPNAYSKSTHNNFKVKPSLIPWKSFFGGLMKVSRRQHNPPPLPIVAFSEDLSRYRPVADLSRTGAKVGLAPLMSDKDVGQERAGFKSKFAIHQYGSHGGSKGKPVLRSNGVENGAFKCKPDLKAGTEDGNSQSKSGFTDKKLQKSIPQYCKGVSCGTVKGAKFPRLSKERKKSQCTNKDVSKGVKIGASRDAVEGQKQRRSAVKERWQGYARKLKPLYEVKGLMGQFRMDECGKNACEVESGIVRRPAWQRRLSHQSSFFKNHKLSMEHEESEGTPYASSNNMQQMAMSSCPPSTRSSPNHSGVLASVGDNKAKLHQSGGNPPNLHIASNASTIKKVVSNESISMSTMHELHSAVQSAIAHCKESNRRCYLE